MNRPDISVVMPVYNYDKYLREAIESILKQTFSDFEFIIINDGSTDNTANILEEYAVKDFRIKIVHQDHLGITSVLNRGLEEARGEWIFRMDADDISLPHRFAIQIEELKKRPSLVLLGGWCQQINQKGIPLKINRYPSSHKKLLRCLQDYKPFFPHATACFPRKAVIRLGGYCQKLSLGEDLDLWLRLSEVGEIGCVNSVILLLRKHPGNISNVYFKQQILMSVAALICYLRRKYRLSDPSRIDESIFKNFVEWIDKNLKEKDYFQYSWLIKKFYLRYKLGDFALKLFEESRDLW